MWVALAGPAAWAVEISVGIGAALCSDLPDRVSKEHTRFGLGPSVQVPVWVGITPSASLRTTLRADVGSGSDRVSWARSVGGESYRFFHDDHAATLVAAGLTMGPELVLPIESPVRPYLGAEAGGAWVATFHDPEQLSAVVGGSGKGAKGVADSGDGDQAGGSTQQFALLTDVHVGVQSQGDVGAWIEVGYSSSYIGSRAIQNMDEALEARREAFGWNSARVGLGLSFKL
jgi:hypothetical protein